MWYKNIAGMFFGLRDACDTHACDRRTDERTDGLTDRYDSKDRASIAASRGKNQTFVDHILLETSQVSDRYLGLHYKYISFMQSSCNPWLIFPSDYLVSFCHIPSYTSRL